MGAGSKVAQADYLSRLIAHLKAEVKQFGLSELPEVVPPIKPETVERAMNRAGLVGYYVDRTHVAIDKHAKQSGFGVNLDSTWRQDLKNYRRITRR